ncbi:hypothetical protein BN1200_860003 [Klebsiella variicola]|nr:hypothetical protein BN1200_860003 [Klebsiella variicola]
MVNYIQFIVEFMETLFNFVIELILIMLKRKVVYNTERFDDKKSGGSNAKFRYIESVECFCQNSRNRKLYKSSP